MSYSEGSQTAEETTGQVTAGALLAHIKGAEVYLHGQAAYGRPSYSEAFIFTVSAKRYAPRVKGASWEDRRAEIVSTLDVPGSCNRGTTSEVEIRESSSGPHHEYRTPFGPQKGFWSLFAHTEDFRAILELLPRDAIVSLQVSLDAGTHEYLVRSTSTMNYETYKGLHADHLYVCATYTRRGKTVKARFLLDTSVVPHTTCRFGYPSKIDG